MTTDQDEDFDPRVLDGLPPAARMARVWTLVSRELVGAVALEVDPDPDLVAICADLPGLGEERPQTHQMLARAVVRHAGRVLAALAGFGLEVDLEHEGILVWDARFADYLQGLGASGPGLAQQIRERARELRQVAFSESLDFGDLRVWWLWQAQPAALGGSTQPVEHPYYPRWVRLLALAVWDSEVCEQVRAQEREEQREQERRMELEAKLKHPALFLPLARTVARVGRPRLVAGRIVDSRGRPLALAPAPTIASEIVTLARGIALFGGVLYDAVIRRMATEAYRLYLDEAHRLFIETEGGVSALARSLGFTHKEAPTDLKALLLAMQQTTVVLDQPGRFRSTALLYDYDEVRAAPGRKARLRIELSDLFRPQAVHSVPRGNPDRALIPVLAAQPPLGAVNRKLQPAALQLEWAALSELRGQARRLHRYGNVVLDWPALAGDVGLPLVSLDPLLASWKAAQRWEESGKGWTLGAPHADAIALVRDAGKEIEEASASASNSWKKRR